MIRAKIKFYLFAIAYLPTLLPPTRPFFFFALLELFFFFFFFFFAVSIFQFQSEILIYRAQPRGRFGRKGLPKLVHFSLL